ncbi:uncharacterized protein ACNS7B_008655 [Menidia menidia]
MIRPLAWTSVLFALSVVDMKALKTVGRVGENVTVTCSNWEVRNVKSYVKYLCFSPCTNKQVIVKAGFEKTAKRDRIQITNKGDVLLVTFMDLKLSDSKTYLCGLERFGWDLFVEVDLRVTNVTPRPKKTVEEVTAGTTETFGVGIKSTTAGLDNTSVWYNTVHTTLTSLKAQGAGWVPYLVVGVIAILAILTVLLMFMRTLRRKRGVEPGCLDASLPHSAHADVENESNRVEDQNQTVPSQALLFSTAHTSPESLYANSSCLQDINLEIEQTYETVTVSNYEFVQGGARAHSRSTDPSSETVYSLPQCSGTSVNTKKKKTIFAYSNIFENDFLYSLSR